MRLLESWTERLNPILVKEVRQALRGRYFRVTYGLTLLAATVVGILTLMSVDDPDRVGQVYFTGIYFCMAGAMLGLVPFQAFVAAGGGGRGSRAELLQLTALRPRQIVAGRLMSSLAQSGLVLAALLPYLALGFLLPGVDLFALFFIVVYTLIWSLAISSVTIAASFLTNNRLVRVLLMVVLGAFQFGFTSSAVGLAAELLDRSENLRDSEFLAVSGLFAAMGLSIGLFAFIGGTLRIAHPEENRSTPLRVFMLLFAFIGALLSYLLTWFVRHPEPEFPLVGYLMLGFFMLIPGGIFASEPERLGRRVQVTAPRNRTIALLAAPLMPGGGNGALFNTLVLAFFGLLPALFPAMDPDEGDAWGSLFLFAGLWGFAAFNLPTAILQRWVENTWVRVVAVFSPILFFIVTGLLPAMVGFVIGDRDLQDFEHPLFFPWAFERLTRSSQTYWEAIWAVAIALFVITLAVNLPRMKRGVQAVLLVSKRRRELEAARTDTKVQAPELPSESPIGEAVVKEDSGA
ncbi:MAG: hypothetical protein VX899_25025 [Myxococcota bacterium]|nr:hypothetical protein [Myxococcota bacterium]